MDTDYGRGWSQEDIIKWSNVAYDLAHALEEVLLDGHDGPPEHFNRHEPGCECLVHGALKAWGDAQMELLDRVNPGWRDEEF